MNCTPIECITNLNKPDQAGRKNVAHFKSATFIKVESESLLHSVELKSSMVQVCLQYVSRIRTSLTCLIWQWWFGLRLESIFTTVPAASKNDAHFKSG